MFNDHNEKKINKFNFENLSPVNFLKYAARVFPDEVAIKGTELSLTYKDFYNICVEVTEFIRQRNVKNGDKIAIFARNSSTVLILHYAIILAGAVLVPVNAMFSTTMLTYILNKTDSKMLFADRDLFDNISVFEKNKKVKFFSIEFNVFRSSKYLGIADVKEAALIRRILPDTNFVIIYQSCTQDIEAVVSGNYIPSVSNLNFAERLDKESKKQSKKCRIHIEIDTGFGRLGVNTQECLAFAKKIKSFKNLVVEGIFMHYCCADSFIESDLKFTELQTTKFKKSVAEIESVLGKIPYKHACAGAAIFNQNAAHFDMVRPGYMLYGYYPSEALKDKVLLKPSLKFVSVIVQINEYNKNTSISYNRTFVTKRKIR
ncbi:MAG: alanine racemase [Firmicutes bacterium]|nr:alanine racemase [Bacillota bacterium]